jgi:hypothetical protein
MFKERGSIGDSAEGQENSRKFETGEVVFDRTTGFSYRVLGIREDGMIVAERERTDPQVGITHESHERTDLPIEDQSTLISGPGAGRLAHDSFKDAGTIALDPKNLEKAAQIKFDLLSEISDGKIEEWDDDGEKAA